MKDKRGQVTIFIIIGIVIISAVVIISLILSKNVKPKSELSLYTNEISKIVQDCLKETGEQALVKIGKQGGYFIITSNIKSIEGKIPYYIYDGEGLMPSKEEISSQINEFIIQRLSFCVLNFKEYTIKNRTLNITHNLKEINTSFVNKKVIIQANYPITLNKNNESYSFKYFKVEIPFDFNGVYSKVNSTFYEVKAHYPDICLNCLYEVSLKEKLFYDAFPYGYNTNITIFSIVDNFNLLNNQSYEWNFAIK